MAVQLTLAAILKEPADSVSSFVDWHRSQGVTRFHLCFDDPSDPAADLFLGAPDVVVERGTSEFWSVCGIAANKAFPMRQNHFLTYAYRAAPAGWFAACDGDEFFHLDGRSLAEELDAQEPETVSVTFRTAEHVQTPHDPEQFHFRLPMPRWLRQSVYPTLSLVTRSRDGLAGHLVGKSCTRVGLGSRVRIRQHWAAVQGRTQVASRVMGPADGAHLLHFVDRGFDNWRSKLEWRMSSRGYGSRMNVLLEKALASETPEEVLWTLYAELHVFGPERLAMLDRAGKLVSVPAGRFGTAAGAIAA